jgi:hypothetical protein
MYSWRSNSTKKFVDLIDENKKATNILGIVAPFAQKKDKYLDLKHKGHYFIGVSSYQNFPEKIINPGDSAMTHQLDTINTPELVEPIIGWCYCSKNPERYLPDSMTRTLLPESDFMNIPSYNYNANQVKKYDFIYNCQQGTWQDFCRNWKLGKQCVKIMCEKYNLKVLLVGKKGAPDEPKHKNVECTGFLKWNDFKKKMSESRNIFIPNIYDASPRVAAEAMIFNLPVLENKNIIGGWHYINDKTGMQFNDLSDFETVLTKFLKKKTYEPRKWYTTHHGKKNASKKLYNFVKGLEMPLYRKDSVLDVFDNLVGINYSNIEAIKKDAVGLHFKDDVKVKVVSANNNLDLSKLLDGSDKGCTLFLVNGCKISNVEKLNHDLSLYFNSVGNDWDILFLGGDSKKKTDTEYLYYSNITEITNIPAFAINNRYLLDTQDAKSNSQISLRYVKKGGLFKNGFNSLKNSFSFAINRSEKKVLFNNITNNITYDYHEGQFKKIGDKKWQEVKKGKHWAYFTVKEETDKTLLLYDAVRKYDIKLENDECYFRHHTVANNGKWQSLFTCKKTVVAYAWHYKQIGSYFVYSGDGVWKEYKKEKLFATFTEESKNNAMVDLYDKSRKLYVRLLEKDSFFSYDKKKWNPLSSGRFVSTTDKNIIEKIN